MANVEVNETPCHWSRRLGTSRSILHLCSSGSAHCGGSQTIWRLSRPHPPEVEAAFGKIDAGITPPDTILPRFAHLLYGDRERFYGFHSDPGIESRGFESGLQRAQALDNAEASEFIKPPIGTPVFDRGMKRYRQHVKQSGTHTERYLARAGVQVAFHTNDSVWWFFSVDRAFLEPLVTYAKGTAGLRCESTPAFGL
jgi:hypothetical protein